MAKVHKVIGVLPSRSYQENARIILPQKVEEVYTWEPFIRDETRREELHNMRISIKRLRYTMELFRVAYQVTIDRNSQYAEFLAVIVDLQEILGDIHDADVVLEVLTDYASQLNNQGEQVNVFPGIATRIAQAKETRKVDYNTFMEKWEHLSVTNFKQKLLSFLTS